MARPGRPIAESYQPVCCSVSQSASYSSESRLMEAEDSDDRAPIFSLSKSAMDVVMATGPSHKRDLAWTRMNLRRSSSTNTHAERNSLTLQQLHPHMWQHINSADGHQLSLATDQHTDVHSPPALSERWIANMHRWSECSGSTHSRSSTLDTIVWKGGTSCPSSLIQETPSSPMSKPTSWPTTPSPLNSPLQTPTLTSEGPSIPSSSSSSSSMPTQSTHQQDDFLASLPSPSTLPSPLQGRTSSPLPCDSPDILRLKSTEDEGFLENNSLSFTLPTPNPSSVSLAEAGASSNAECLIDNVVETLHSPGGTEVSEGGGVRGPAQTLSYPTTNSPTDGQESGRIFHLALPWHLGQSCSTERGWSSPLVSSLSDSLLGYCCRCNLNTRGTLKAQVFREEATMTSQLELVDAAVQTISPISSSWGLRKNTSNSNMGSHSFLGSPPGSRLNLKSSVGSNSNLVSPSSSMFPASSSEEARQGEDPTWDVNSASSQDLERRRSCLKMKILQEEERDSMGRRSSMKQVQWDEDGMTWDVHGATLDPEVLSSAIRKHLELQNSPRPLKRTSKKKAPKPPLISNVVKATAPRLHPPVMVNTSTCTAEVESEGTLEEDRGRKEVKEEGGGEGKTEETVQASRRISTANTKEDDEANGEEGHPKSPSSGSGHSRKKSVIRSLRRPGWCGGSSKADD